MIIQNELGSMMEKNKINAHNNTHYNAHNRDGYWCVICGRFLVRDEDGLIAHDDLPHPEDMVFNDDQNPQ